MLSLNFQILLIQVVLLIFFTCVIANDIAESNIVIDCEDVLEENRELKAEIKWLNDVITNNISEIMKNLEKQSEDVELLKEEDTNIKVNVGLLFDLHDDLQNQLETDLTDVNAQIVSQTVV